MWNNNEKLSQEYTSVAWHTRVNSSSARNGCRTGTRVRYARAAATCNSRQTRMQPGCDLKRAWPRGSDAPSSTGTSRPAEAVACAASGAWGAGPRNSSITSTSSKAYSSPYSSIPSAWVSNTTIRRVYNCIIIV